MKKRIVSILLAAVMVVAMIPVALVSAFAAEDANYMAYVANPTLDGKNTNSEYDNTYEIPINSGYWWDGTANATVRTVYSDDAIYILVEAFHAYNVNDTMHLFFDIGGSYIGSKGVIRDGNTYQTISNMGGSVDLGHGKYGLDSNYFVMYSDDTTFSLEAKFSVENMNEDDKAAFANGTLEVKVAAAITQQAKTGNVHESVYNIWRNFVYNSTKPTSFDDFDLPVLTFAAKDAYEDNTESASFDYMSYVANPTFDGKNTNGEYDNAYSILFTEGPWGASPTGKESLRVVYSADAIYVLLESIDNTDDTANSGDFFALSFAIGTSFVSTQIEYRQDAPQYTNQGGTVSMSTQWSLSSTYFKKTVTEDKISFEAKFPVSKMNDADKAAFADRTLSVKIGAAISNDWKIVETFSGIYNNRAKTTSIISGATALSFAEKGAYADKTVTDFAPYIANPFLDGVNTNGEYDNALEIPFDTALWGNPLTGNETFKVAYSDDAIYVYFESKDSDITVDDFIFLNYRIGTSFHGTTQHNAKHNSEGNGWDANTKIGGNKNLQTSWFQKSITETGWSIEGKFIFDKMNNDDKAALENGTLDIGFSVGYVNNWGNDGGSQTQADAYSNANKDVSTCYTIGLDKKGTIEDTTLIPFESGIVFDGKNTEGEYNDAFLANFYVGIWSSAPTSGNETFRILYTSEAIYFLFESIDDVEIDPTNEENIDFIYFNFKIGTSFCGSKTSVRTVTDELEGASNLGGTVDVVEGQSKYFKKNNTAEGWTLEVRFPVADMNEEDKAAFAAGTLEVAFSSAYCDAWGGGKNGSSQTQRDAYGNYNNGTLTSCLSFALEKNASHSSFEGANVALGSDITVKYYAMVYGDAAAKVKFTMDGKDPVEVTGKPTDVKNQLVFALEGVSPQCMGDNIKAELFINGSSVDSIDEYSVLANVTSEDVLNEKTQQLVYDLLAYGAAAQVYTDYKTNALVNVGYEELATAVDSIRSTIDKTPSEALDDGFFTAAGVHFANTNKIYAKFETTDDAATVTINGVEAEIIADGDNFIVYSEEIIATDFDAVYTFVLTTTTGTQTFKYSVNEYAAAKMDADNIAMADLARALYAYGKSAEKYAG